MIIAQQISDTTGSSILSPTSGNNFAIVLISLCNFTSATSSVNINIVPSGSVVGNSNYFIKNRVLDSNESLVLSTEKILLGSGDSLWMASSVSSSVSTVVSYMAI